MDEIVEGAPNIEDKIARFNKSENQIRLSIKVWPTAIQLGLLSLYFGLLITLSVQFLF